MIRSFPLFLALMALALGPPRTTASAESLDSKLSGANRKQERRDWRISPRKAKTENPLPSNTDSLAKGGEIYVAECESCHGPAGQGDGPEAGDLDADVPDLTLASAMDESDGALFWKLTLGRKPMPSYRKTLSKEERWHVVNYLHTLCRGAENSGVLLTENRGRRVIDSK